jgi:hypothetical protein
MDALKINNVSGRFRVAQGRGRAYFIPSCSHPDGRLTLLFSDL